MSNDQDGPRFSFVHAADLHLDTPFKGIGVSAPFVAHQLREASLRAFDQLVALCVDRQAAFLVLAGDLYDGPERGLRAQLRLRDGLERLASHDIPSFLVHGNHDPVGPGWSAVARSWPELATVFGPETVGIEAVTRDGVVLATIQGISYARRNETRNLAQRFSHRPGPGLNVGVLHCNVAGAASGYDDYSPCTLEDLRSAGIDYWALGHIHSAMVLSGKPGSREPWVVYPGNLQARSPKPSERGPKGAVVVQVRGTEVTGLENVACDGVRFAVVDIDVAALGDVAQLRDALQASAAACLSAQDGRSLILRARLVGRGKLAVDLRRDGTVAELLETLRGDFTEELPFCWWDSIEDASAPEFDLVELRSASDFTADLVRTAEDLRADLESIDGESLLADLADELAEGLPGGARSRALVRDLLESGATLTPDLVERGLGLALDELDRG